MGQTPSDPTDQELNNASGGFDDSRARGNLESFVGGPPPEAPAPAGAGAKKKLLGLIPFVSELSAVANLGVSTHKKIEEDNTKVVKSQNDIATRYKMMDIIDKGESQ